MGLFWEFKPSSPSSVKASGLNGKEPEPLPGGL